MSISHCKSPINSSNCSTQDTYNGFYSNLEKNNCNRMKAPDRTLVPISPKKCLRMNIKGTDYINASYVNDKKFIVTQYPHENTIEAFYKMCWEHNIGMIINLDMNDDFYPRANIGVETLIGAITVKALKVEIISDNIDLITIEIVKLPDSSEYIVNSINDQKAFQTVSLSTHIIYSKTLPSHPYEPKVISIIHYKEKKTVIPAPEYLKFINFVNLKKKLCSNDSIILSVCEDGVQYSGMFVYTYSLCFGDDDYSILLAKIRKDREYLVGEVQHLYALDIFRMQRTADKMETISLLS